MSFTSGTNVELIYENRANATAGWQVVTSGANTPVVPENVYSLTMAVRAAATARTLQGYLNWYNAAFSYLSTAYGPSLVDTTSGWTIYTASGPAPAGAAFVTPVLLDFNSASAVGEVHYMDGIDIELATPLPVFSTARLWP